MIRDLRTILDGWDFEPGKISVRKIIGREGREKIQTRIDLGVLQLECAGRPDGQRPRGCESLLAYYEQRLREHVAQYGDDADFVLGPEDCRDLRQEAYLYYQRYLSLFVLEEFDGVERDTARNLRLIEFCERYAASESDRRSVQRQKAYVMMMHTRGRAYAALQRSDTQTALAIVEAGMAAIAALDEASSGAGHASELNTLAALRDEVLLLMPLDAPARLQAELDLAVECEDYESAARIRDRMAQMSGSVADRPVSTSAPLDAKR